MKIISLLVLFFAAVLIGKGQGTFLYDQQSATNGIARGGTSINQGQPIGQAFTPSLSAVGFVQLQLWNGFNLTNATIAVHLWADSLGGTLLGSTDPLSLPAGGYATRTTTFLFASPVTLTPGSTYYFQPVIQSGGNNDWVLGADFYNYPGEYFFQGVPQPGGLNLWFREGVVPEPSAIVLLGLGLGVLLYARRVHIKHSSLP